MRHSLAADGGSAGTQTPTTLDASGEGSESGVPNYAAGASGNAEVPLGDASASTRCGDGRVSGIETCDVAIEPGQPGACPSEADCEALGTSCTPRALNNGNTCQAECSALPAVCKSGDGCCPSPCAPERDSDCSASCRDGIVQPENGETCEPGSEAAPCKTASDCDDADACTTDTLTGSPDNCNVTCLNTKVVQLRDGDGCCPDGADNNADKDCAPHCGNGVREADEPCDGEQGCGEACHWSSEPPSATVQPCPETGCTNSCFPLGILPCCNLFGVCGCSWAPGAYCL